MSKKQQQIKTGTTGISREKANFVKEIIAGKHQQDGWYGFSLKDSKPSSSK